MLRWGLLAVGLIFIGVGLTFSLMPAEARSGLPFLLWGLVITIAVLCERWRYSRRHPEGKRWQRTGECFEDPETGQIMDVLYDPVSGERKYEPRVKS